MNTHEPQARSSTFGRMQTRLADINDALPIVDIYNHEIETGVATFDLVARTLDEQRLWLRERSGVYPCIVAENKAKILGWACLSAYKPRAAYATSVENSVYVHPDHQGKGVGNLLLSELIVLANEHGFHSIFARITGNNEASIELHSKHGFQVVGVERQVGRKFGRWLDVTVMQRLSTEQLSC